MYKYLILKSKWYEVWSLRYVTNSSAFMLKKEQISASRIRKLVFLLKSLFFWPYCFCFNHKLILVHFFMSPSIYIHKGLPLNILHSPSQNLQKPCLVSSRLSSSSLLTSSLLCFLSHLFHFPPLILFISSCLFSCLIFSILISSDLLLSFSLSSHHVSLCLFSLSSFVISPVLISSLLSKFSPFISSLHSEQHLFIKAHAVRC